MSARLPCPPAPVALEAFAVQFDPCLGALRVCGVSSNPNVGAAAGQTVFHYHLHLIPRRAGEVADLRGGVRHTIPVMLGD
jgi:hypothetical protein